MFDIITIGDTTTDVFLFVDEDSPLCRIDRKKMELKLTYSGKIPVRELHRVIGAGNAANHAFGAAKLGLKTAIYTIVGDDDAGDAVKHKLTKAGVATDYLVVDKKHGTNMSTIIDYDGDRTILSYHAERSYHLPDFAKSRWIYFSSISNDHEKINEKLSRYVKENKIKLGFNPGSRQMAVNRKLLQPILDVTEVLFVNKQEAERLTKRKSSIKNLLKNLCALGPKIAVVTDGENGSYCFDGHVFYKLGIMKLPIAESTGAGDAYASAFVAARMDGESIAESMRMAGANAASVAGKIGSQTGLLSKHQIHSLLSEHKYFVAKEF